MSDPSKVIGLLTLAGRWQPPLGWVLRGTILVGLVAFRFAAGRKTRLLGAVVRLPTASHRRLVLGGLAFGASRGLAGFCPGPAPWPRWPAWRLMKRSVCTSVPACCRYPASVRIAAAMTASVAAGKTIEVKQAGRD